MYKTYSISITLICGLFGGTVIAKDVDPKFKDREFWEDKITESFATDIVNEIPNMIRQETLKRELFEQSTDDAYLAKLKVRFFSYVQGNKINQARIISKIMAKKGDDTGERYLQSLE